MPTMSDVRTEPDHTQAVLTLALRPSLPSPERARQILHDRGVLMTEVAAALSVSPQTISNWLHGRHTPVGARRDRYAMAIRLIEAGGFDLASLAPEDDDA